MHSLLKLILFTMLFTAVQLSFAGQNNNSSMANVFRGMITGLNLLGQASGSYSGQPSPFFIPGAYAGNNHYSLPPYANQNTPYNQTLNRSLQELQGSWKINNEKLLIVKGNMARLYLAADRYQDLYLQANQRFLWMRPDGSKSSQQYEHRIFYKSAILRDRKGRQIMLQRYTQN